MFSTIVFAQIPEKFNYQAVIRDNVGELIKNQDVTVQISIIEGSAAGTTIYSEQHSKITNNFGMVNLEIGNGTSPVGTFSSINWGVSDKFLNVQVNTGSGLLDMGTMQLLSVPYALYAKDVENKDDADADPANEIQDLNLTDNVLTITNNPEPTEINLSAFTGTNTDEQELTLDGDTLRISNGNEIVLPYDSSQWAFNGDKLYYNMGNVGVGSSNPLSKLEVKSASTSGALFQVINANNDTVFAVYPDGVKVFVDASAKGNIGGFAVSGRTSNKAGESLEYFRVTPDSTRIYVNEDSTKGNIGGFAVSGRTSAKGTVNDYLQVTRDSTRIYITEPTVKGNIGGFAVSGRTSGKLGEPTRFMDMTKDNYFIGHQSGSVIANGLYNSFVGYEAGMSNTDGSNGVFIGYRAGYSNDTGNSNVFIGNESGRTNTLGESNVFLGYNSGYGNTEGNNNTFLGHVAGFTNSTGNNNVFLGDSSGFYNTIGEQNIFLGNGSGKANTDGDYNAYIGFRAGHKNKTGNNNAFIGYQAGYTNETGNNNAFIGYQAGWKTWKGGKNVCIGYQAGYSNVGIAEGPTQPGNNNIYIGDQSALYNTTGRSNVYIGHNAGYGMNPINAGSPPRFNVYIGYQAGYTEYSGRNNTFIGYQVGYSNYMGDFSTFIGDQAGFTNYNGDYNTFIGFQAGYSNYSGNYNLFIGNEAGRTNSTGAGNIFLGYRAGYYETGSDKLFIDSKDRTSEALSRTSSLIYGEFNADVSSQVLRVNGKLEVNRAIALPISTVTTNTTLGATHYTVLVNAATATITLPAASTCSGRIYVIKKINSTAGNITIDGYSAETIDGVTTILISTLNDKRVIQSDGTGWYIIN
ncbi:MAG: hypothetical protein A2X13_04355 [Bacteroidetes bacterium GWC2_33_15]|nr:MAG: hypothetical protein A2X10_11765 [Bacteroidetes bacterium GWA2_33_15]OFX49748.1 MAG: hypothetical protein A2X13_04355 [Bacteroidetes bacterium GWC2_33_15]OFX68377.1 MAG: hypothetical protein A2X14_08415 [Bacteroidetes bacterium GWD2_33_33]HAN18167.1 hypothetical protein [Bacteroidales bacterium]